MSRLIGKISFKTLLLVISISSLMLLFVPWLENFIGLLYSTHHIGLMVWIYFFVFERDHRLLSNQHFGT